LLTHETPLNMDEKLDKDELIKSLTELGFEQSEIDEVILKGEKEDKFSPKKEEDEETIDEAEAESAEKKDGKEDADDMKKSYDKIMNMKSEIDKSMADFLEKYGCAPGIKTPDTDLEKVKSEKEDIQKSEANDFEKAFGSKFETIEKGLSDQSKINDEFLKSLQNISETVKAIAETPNPFKGVFGNYKGNILEKGEKVDANGKRILSLSRDKETVLDEFAKAVDKVDNEQDKQLIRDAISTLNISNRVSPQSIEIVKSTLNIDIEK